MRKKILIVAILAVLSLSGTLPSTKAVQKTTDDSVNGRLIGEIFANGQQMHYLSMLSDEIGSRLTGSANARQAVMTMEAEMKRIGLANVRRESFNIPVSWERGLASATLV